MTLVNRLIREARSNPEHLTINLGQVREIAAHAHSLMMATKRPSIEEIETWVKQGKMQMCGIPVRVLGCSPDQSWYCEPCAVEVYSVRCPHCGKTKRDPK